MISAIAARKAAKAEQQSHQTVAAVHETPDLPNLQKRARVRHDARPTSKKRKKETTTKRRNVQPKPDEFVAQQEVIFIESDDDDEEEEEEEILPSQQVSESSEMEVNPCRKSTTRAWSPSAPLHNSSSDEEDIEMEDRELINLPPRFSRPIIADTGGPLSTFVPVQGQNIFSLSADDVVKLHGEMVTRGTIVLLKPGEKLCLLGVCRLTLLRGIISINGVVLQPSRHPHTLFAPRSSPLPVIEARSETSSPVIDALSLPPSLQLHARTTAPLFLLQELRSGVEGLGRVCRTFEDVYRSSSSQETGVTAPFELDGLFLVTDQIRGVSPFVLPASWSKATSVKPPQPIFLVKGPKKCGKSTFSITLLNTLLTRYQRVAFLECDLGQSEFTPGGLVTLNVLSLPIFGPSFTHPSIPVRAHYIGATTPRSSPSHYLDAIQNLIQTYRLDVQYSPSDEDPDDPRISETVPLVVNTMGWSKGLGADLTRRIEEMVEPGQVFEFQSEDCTSPSGNAPMLLEPAPVSSLSTNFTAADHRTISLLSYFHSIFPSAEPLESRGTFAQAWDTTIPLCAMLPYEVDIRVAVDKFILTGAGYEDVVAEEVARVLNGAIVGLVQSDYHYPNPQTIDASIETSHKLPYTQGESVPSPSESTCIGLALIRGIQPPFLHLLTPIPPHRLSGARLVMVKGEMELPVWGMLDFRNMDGGVGQVVEGEKGQVPYLQWGRLSDSAIGAERRRVRRNLMRRGQA